MYRPFKQMLVIVYFGRTLQGRKDKKVEGNRNFEELREYCTVRNQITVIEFTTVEEQSLFL